MAWLVGTAGLALLLLGMRALTGGLALLAGGTLSLSLARVGRRPWTAAFVGAAATALVQSSSATTILLVGMVDAGVIGLDTAACMVIGANVGTTVTAHLIASSPGASLGWVLVAAAALLAVLARGRAYARLALGLGMIVLGLDALQAAVLPASRTPAFAAAMGHVARSPLLGLASGTVLTAVVLSSGVTIGMLQSLVAHGALPLAAALPVLFGDNVGTTSDTLLASLATGGRGRRLALFHLLFNVAGTLMLFPLIPVMATVLPHLSALPARQVALAHSLFNVASALVWLPGRRLLLRLSGRPASRRGP